MNKTECLALLQLSWHELLDALSLVPEDQRDSTLLENNWTVKDMVAHVSAWERELAIWLNNDNNGHEPGVPNFTDDYVNGFNAAIYAENRARSYEEVYQNLLDVHDHMLLPALHEMADAPDDDPCWSRWRDGLPPWRLIAGNSYDHYPEHVEALKFAFQL